MKNKRMKADGVDQLFEIVKAVQMGQDPEEVLRKKQAESAPLADSPKLHPNEEKQFGKQEDAEEIDSEWESEPKHFFGKRQSVKEEKQSKKSRPERIAEGKVRSEEVRAEEEWDDDDDFMEILNDDQTESLNVGAFAENIGKGLSMLAGLLPKASKKDNKKKIKKHSAKAESAAGEEESDPASADAEVLSDTDKTAAEWPSDTEKAVAERPSDTDKTAAEQQTDAEESGDEAEILKRADESAADGEWTTEQSREKSEDEKTIDRILDIPNTAGENDAEHEISESADELPDQGIDLEEDAIRAQSDKEQEASVKRKISGRLSEEPEQMKEQDSGQENRIEIRNLLPAAAEKLRNLGIHRKELVMLAIGLVLVVFLVVLVSGYIRVSMEDKKKSEHVTADAGLKITVEKEPEQWCRSYPVSMKVRLKRSAVSKVMIDGAYYEPNEEGIITVRARDYLLQASVEAEDGTLQAQIEIPKIDAQIPVVKASKENNMITLTAADGRSGVAKIRYAAVRANDYIRIPRYLAYTEPFPYEEGTIYYFYAEDFAGNKSMPVVTTMEEAEAIVPAQEEYCLFPGETAYLNVNGRPHGALLNNLSYESMNPEVATVDGSGLVTAISEGATAIKIKAEGLPEVLCGVEVSRNRQITISAIGDCTLGSDYSFNTNINFQAFETVNGPSYFFRNVSDILKNDDATFANLEGVFTDLNTRESKQYAFKGDPDYTQILLDGSVEVVTLANNHSNDYGEQSQKDTKQYLSHAGIDYCIGDTIAIQEIKGVRTAFIGIYVLYDGMAREEQVRATIAEARAQGAQLVIVGFHWGSEKATQPDQIQTSLAHIAVDAGADLVVGHHPHVLQGIEKYNGTYIVYSLGNFCFGGNTNPSDKDTIIFRQTFTIEEGMVQDDDQIEIIPCTISGSSGYNDYQPAPVSGTEADRIMDRLNEYSAQFEQSFTASTGLE